MNLILGVDDIVIPNCVYMSMLLINLFVMHGNIRVKWVGCIKLSK